MLYLIQLALPANLEELGTVVALKGKCQLSKNICQVLAITYPPFFYTCSNYNELCASTLCCHKNTAVTEAPPDCLLSIIFVCSLCCTCCIP